MKANSKKDSVLKLVSYVVKHEANANSKGWPPACTGFLHQPKRPENLKKK